MATGPKALIVRGGWEGHSPAATGQWCAQLLGEAGYQVTVSGSLDSYLDAGLLAATDLVVQCWTMGRLSAGQSAGLRTAVRAGTGFAGWHGGIVDAFREDTDYQLLTGGQFVYHPQEFVSYQVTPTAAGASHPALAGIGLYRVTTEQYYVHTAPGVEVLAVTEFAEDQDQPQLAGTVVPVTWAQRWGAGRVFVTTVGHRLADLTVPEVTATIRQGMVWATR
ncbi:ThuA domain-containing protein [Kitasatospora sp. NPDC002227]|uniref:ThuA domain-containing protein n=1 Tax=Kitasatospora sp. NPDC002227 TaxID=3154773 RepID=UPI003327FA2A